MPEIHMPNNEFVRAVKKEVKGHKRALDASEVFNLAQKYNAEVVGRGTECIVIPTNDGKRETVAAFNYHDLEPLTAKEIFYSQRVLSTLFPDNFPHFYASFGAVQDSGVISGTIRQKINLNDRLPTSGLSLDTFYKIQQILKDRCDLNFVYDVNTKNFSKQKSGEEYYLDKTVDILGANFDAKSIPKVVSYMEEAHFDPIAIKTVVVSLERLLEIRNQKFQRDYHVYRGMQED